MSKISQAFIFCAGRGERMMPLTQDLPKPLLLVNNKPILFYIINKIKQIPSINKIIINAYYLSEEIIKFVESLNDKNIILSIENEKLETGGGLVYALDKIDIAEPLLTLNGDILWEDRYNFKDLELLMNNFDPKNHDILLGLKKFSDFIGYDGKFGDFDLNNKKLSKRNFTNNDKNFIPMSHIYVGLQVLNPKILQGNHPKCFSVSQFYKNALNSKMQLERVQGLELAGKYFHIGTPANLALANKEYSEIL